MVILLDEYKIKLVMYLKIKFREIKFSNKNIVENGVFPMTEFNVIKTTVVAIRMLLLYSFDLFCVLL